MKKILNLSISALALFGAIACNTAPVEEVTGTQNVVTASFVDSRTALAEGVKTVWSAGDKIDVNGVTFALTSGAGEATAVFTSAQPVEAAQNYTATYPAGVTAVPTEQNAVAGSFDPAAALASATSASLSNMLFEHKHALVKFSLPADAAKVELLGYTLAGDIKSGNTYYLAVAAGEYAGVTAKVDGVVVKESNNALNAVNGKIYNLGTLSSEAVEGVGIRTADDLLAFAVAVNGGATDGGEWKDENGVVNILANIDMKGKEWTVISNFTGTLEGNNYTIDNLVFETADAYAAMFKNLSDATVQNLTFGKGCKFVTTSTAAASYVSAVVGQILTGATIQNVKSYATLEGGTFMGSMCGAANKKAGNILVSECTNYGTVTFPEKTAPGNVVMGGLCGQSENKVTFENCTNEGAMYDYSTGGNKYNKVGGILGGLSDTVIKGCSNSGTITIDVLGANKVWIGGIAGCGYRQGNIDNCSNSGSIVVDKEVTCVNIYAGGIFGSAEGKMSTVGKISNCSNTADIEIEADGLSANALLAGICGYYRLDGVNIEDCTNSGALTLSTNFQNSAVAGIVGYASLQIENKLGGSVIKNCTNTGAVKGIQPSTGNCNWLHIAGIMGKANDYNMSIDGCINRGTISITHNMYCNVGGIISECRSDISNCTNYGTIIVNDAHIGGEDVYDFSGAAGIAGRLADTRTVSACKNYGTVVYMGKGFSVVNSNQGIVGQGGIVGLMNKGTIDNCENYGTVLSNDSETFSNAKGSIVGWGGRDAAVTISNCKVSGALGAYNATAEDMGASAATAVTAENYADYIYGGDAKNGVTVSNCVFATAQ